MEQRVILVDSSDRAVGEQEKLAVHRSGELHRAFSVFLFDQEGRWLLQRRHPDKYHSGGLWTNTCCSHPAPGETTSEAARKRLKHEMGIEAPIQPAFHFIYRASLDNELIEHELDHVFLGAFDGEPSPDDSEVCDWAWVAEEELLADLTAHPDRYTYWFRLVVPRVMAERGFLATT